MCKPGSVGDLGGQPPRSTRPEERTLKSVELVRSFADAKSEGGALSHPPPQPLSSPMPDASGISADG